MRNCFFFDEIRFCHKPHRILAVVALSTVLVLDNELKAVSPSIWHNAVNKKRMGVSIVETLHMVQSTTAQLASTFQLGELSLVAATLFSARKRCVMLTLSLPIELNEEYSISLSATIHSVLLFDRS